MAAAAVMTVACTKEDLSGTVQPETAQEGIEKPYLPGEVVVKFDASLSDLLDKAGLSKSPATRSGVTTVDEILDIVDGYQLERVFPQTKASEAQTRAAGLHLWYVVRFSEDEDVKEVVKKLSALGEVQSAAPVLTIKKSYDGKVIPFNPARNRAATKTDPAGLPFNDANLAWQWSLVNNGAEYSAQPYRINPAFEDDHAEFPEYPYGGKSATEKFVVGDDIGMAAAWKKCTGDPSIVVAVLDEGICLIHEDLKANLWRNEGEKYGSMEDHDGNGYPGDYFGYDFLNDRPVISWDLVGDTGHGTHVSGVIAAVNNNGTGISSIAGGAESEPGVRLMSCQVFSGNSASSTVSLARAIKYAADNGAVILQCSFGYTSGSANPYEYGTGFKDEDEWVAGSPLEKSALDYFLNNAGSDNGPIKGGIAVFASGNEYAPSAGFPGAYEDCISVAAVAADYTPSTFTNYGPGTDLAAPGGDQDYYYDFLEDGADADERGAAGCILSTVPEHVSESGYGYMEGTSMACPHVSGVAALGLSYAARLHKHFTADEFRELLYEACTPLTDEVLEGDKFYYKWQVDATDLIHARRLELRSYRNQMGAGVVNAAGLLDLIDGNAGVPMKFPNLYIREGGKVAVSPSAYMDGGTFSVSVSDPSVAQVSNASVNGGAAAGSVTGATGTLTFHGLKSGSTKATITPVSGQAQTFVITVRTSDDGWL